MTDGQWIKVGRYLDVLLREKGGAVSVTRDRDSGLLFTHVPVEGKPQNISWWPDKEV